MHAFHAGLLAAVALFAVAPSTSAQQSRYVPLGFAGTNAVVLDLESIQRAGDVVEASTHVWSDSVFIVDGTRAVRRDDRYRVHCGLSRIFDVGSVYRDSLGGVVGDDLPPLDAPPPETWTPIMSGSMLASVALHACYSERVQRSRLHRVILLGEQNTAYLRTIPSSVTVAPGDSVILIRRTDTPIKVRYGKREAQTIAWFGIESDVSHQLDQVTRERAAQNIIWVATRQRTYPEGFLAFQLRGDGREFMIPIRLAK